MSYHFDEDLRGALRQQARGVPLVPDLAGAAIRQARGIRRRRRVAGMVAAAALVALAVPVALQAGDALSRGTTPPPATQGPDSDDGNGDPDAGDIKRTLMTVQLGELAAGEAPTVPYVDGSQLVVDGQSIDLGVDAADIDGVAFAGDTAYYTVVTETGGRRLLSSPAGTDLPVTAGPWASPDGRYVAYVADGAVTVLDTEDGDESTLDVAAAASVSALAFTGEDLFFVAGNDTTLLRWTVGEAEATPVEGIERATAVSADGQLVADMHEVDDLTASTCTQVKELATGAVLWETCDHRIGGFSPDGRYAWGANEYQDGAGDTHIAVLDAQTKELVLRVEGTRAANPPVLFRGAVFESPTTLLIEAGQGQDVALIRCNLAEATCELATELGEVAQPELGWPIRLLG